jgi:hypothetical protein
LIQADPDSPITVTGSGSGGSPYIIGGGGTVTVEDSDTVAFDLSGDGSSSTPYVISAEATVEMAEITDFDPTGGIAGHVVAYDGTGYVLNPPSTATPGAIVVGDGLEGDGSGGDPLRISSVTSTYVPSWFATTTNPDIGSGSIDGRYTERGAWVDVNVQIVLAADTAKGSGTWGISLPVPAFNGRAQIIPFLVTYPNGNIRTGLGLTNGGTDVIRLYVTQPTTAKGSTPATATLMADLGSGGRLILQGTYEREP